MDLDKKAGGLYTAKRSADLEIPVEVQEAWGALRQDGASGPTWIALTVEQASKKVGVAAQGSGGVAELLAALTDDDVFFGGVRVNASGGASTRFLQFYFVGANVGGMKKGKASLWKNGVFNALEGAHGAFEVPGGLDGAADEFERGISGLAGGAGCWTVAR